MNHDTGSINLHWSSALLDGLVAAGARHAVISPGSRNTPLILAADQQPRLHCEVQIDERSAAFFALGLARADRQPVVLLATSGSAPANWYPAVVEASQSGIPLILLTADRPWELRQCGANQTIDQIRLFGGFVRAYHDLPPAEDSPEGLQRLFRLGVQSIHQGLWPDPGPIHINVPFREPLVPDTDIPAAQPANRRAPVLRAPTLRAGAEQVKQIASTLSGRPGLIVCGDGFFPACFGRNITKLATATASPILADPLSGLRFGRHNPDHICARYDSFLHNEDFTHAHRPEWVLHFGALPVSKVLQTYLQGSVGICHIVVEQRGRWFDPLQLSTETVKAGGDELCRQLLAQPLTPSRSGWLAGFQREEAQAAKPAPNPSLEATIIRILFGMLPPESILFTGNSLPVRQIDRWSGKAERPLSIIANRGASGIDGNVSTLLGLAASHQRREKVVGLLGDLAFYHDMNGLLAARRLDVVIILFNNGGGGIFSHLPQSKLERFDRYWRTPTGLDFEQTARLYQLDFQRVRDGEAFQAALDRALAHRGPDLIEVILEARTN